MGFYDRGYKDGYLDGFAQGQTKCSGRFVLRNDGVILCHTPEDALMLSKAISGQLAEKEEPLPNWDYS